MLIPEILKALLLDDNVFQPPGHFPNLGNNVRTLKDWQAKLRPELEAKYPNAAFALMILDNLFAGDREQNEIHQKAYTAILNGDSITGMWFK